MRPLLVLMISVIATTRMMTAFAGSLEPPGPPGPTMKTLEEMEPRIPISSIPYTISGPGSYYLTKNLTLAQASSFGIRVQSADVILDLNGFTLNGNAQGGIGVDANTQSTTVRNGIVRGWTDVGFRLLSQSTIAHDLISIGNGTGFLVINAVLSNCSARANSTIGIQAQYSTVRNCSAHSNVSVGFYLFNSVLSYCHAQSNGGAGIDATDGSVVEACFSGRNFFGILTSNSNIRGNTVVQNDADGIRADTGNLISDNSTNKNGVAGLYDGIVVLGDGNRVVRNNATDNDGGISVSGSFNTIDDNNMHLNNVHGLYIRGTKNTVIRNIATQNGPLQAIVNFDIGVGNNAGPVTAAASATNPLSNTQ